MKHPRFVIPLSEVRLRDVALVGGKNASLGEMISQLTPSGIKVPGGFVVTAAAYRHFLAANNLDQLILKELKGLNTKNLAQLARRGAAIRNAITRASFPKDLAAEIDAAYRRMEKEYGSRTDVAVRSSATAEDLPGASFAGEHETYLGVRGSAAVLSRVRAAMASLYTDRAISYRVDKHFDHASVALSVGVQHMVRSDRGASGVMFTLDTESGFRDVVIINASWGLGEMIVQGQVTPDEYLVFKPLLAKSKNPIIEKHLGSKERTMIYGQDARLTKIIPTPPRDRTRFVLSDKEIVTLASWGAAIERHYSKLHKGWTPMDIEWAKDGTTGQLYIVQARPETIHAGKDFSTITQYQIKGSPTAILNGASVGARIVSGKARVILDAKKIREFKKGEILVTDMTDPDWEPIMKIAGAIVTDKGGRTSHAAIVSRELGIPAIVGTERATDVIKTGETITVDASTSEGRVYRGQPGFLKKTVNIKSTPQTRTHIMVNVAIPTSAFELSFLPHRGVGLAREEFIIASKIGVHPNAILDLPNQTPATKRAIEAKAAGWPDPVSYYVDTLSYGIARIASAFYPHPVIVRFSDFKSNEYRTLLGGDRYEPDEENPMIGWRGASRYYDPKFQKAFQLECRALKKVRDAMGLTNAIPMIPFCRTVEEGRKVLHLMAQEGLVTRTVAREKKLKRAAITPVYVMCEIPSNVILANDFLDIFDGMSIGSNDLTQLTLGLDRDSSSVNHVANENDPAVKTLIEYVINVCRKRGKYIGICGQAPSDYPDFARFLVASGINSISLNPDTVVPTTIAIAKEERRRKPRRS